MERNQTYQQQKKTIGMPRSRDGLEYLVERAWRMQLASPADAERRATSSWDEFWGTETAESGVEDRPQSGLLRGLVWDDRGRRPKQKPSKKSLG